MCFMRTKEAVFLTRNKEIVMKAAVQKTLAYLLHHHRDGASSQAVMELDPAGETFVLRGRQFARIDDASGWRIRALDGTLWITQDGDIRDVVLESGQTYTPDRPGRVLLSPFGEARVCLTRGRECGAASRSSHVPSLVHANAVPA